MAKKTVLASIPTSMATQHPDSASRYVPIQAESEEAVEALTPQPDGLGIEELMIDFEGKMTPYHQTGEIAQRLLAQSLVPGKDVWITPRISSATEETAFRQLMALMSIIEADYDIAKASLAGGIKEIVLPMVKKPGELLMLRQRIADIFELAHKEFGLERDPNALQVVPLVEGVPQMLNFHILYQEYFQQSRARGFTNERLRFMAGRSDSALSCGLVPSVLAVKLLLARAYRLAEKLDIEAAPILGGGSLPFRGHVTLANVDQVIQDFGGVRTITIQSGLRYDHDREDVAKLVNRLKEDLPRAKPLVYEAGEEQFLQDAIVIFYEEYFKVLRPVIDRVAALSDVLPQQRDRLTRRGPMGYARTLTSPEELTEFASIREVKRGLSKLPGADFEGAPRAITFTGALYSVGLPPELLGTGRGLAEIEKVLGKGSVGRLLAYYPGLPGDLTEAARFLHLNVAERFFPREIVAQVREGLATAADLVDVDLLGQGDRAYQTLLEIIEPLLRQRADGHSLGDEDRTLLRSCIVRLGKMRGSLG